MNRQWKLIARPVGLPKRSDFELVTTPIPAPAPGEVLVQITHVSLDPAMRGWMNDAKSYVPPIGIGEVMRAGGLGRVERSEDPAFVPGDLVTGMLGIQEWACVPGKLLQKIDPSLASPTTWLGALGMTGMTAYFGLHDVGRPEPGQTVVVSGAAGAVGMMVGQLAKLHGCRAVGLAGGPEKCKLLLDLGFDAAIDYKRDDLRAAMRAACPQGIDVYFDNVGGEILDLALANLARKARVVICGAIANYNATEPPPGPRNYMALLVQRARMEGFLVFDYYARFGEAIPKMAAWLREGKLQAREDIVAGLETFPETLLRLFRGDNIGKLILAV